MSVSSENEQNGVRDRSRKRVHTSRFGLAKVLENPYSHQLPQAVAIQQPEVRLDSPVHPHSQSEPKF